MFIGELIRNAVLSSNSRLICSDASRQTEENKTDLGQNSPSSSYIMTSEHDVSGCKTKTDPNILNVIFMPPNDTVNVEVRLETS